MNKRPMDDEKYMRRCIELARQGRQYAAPNPMVGAVVVCEGRIIGEGYHRRCGSAHAEVNALGSVSQPELLPHSTLYVSLEPCAHFGRTPPCADLIVAKGIRRVVIGCRDPFPRVDGRGIQKLIDAGCEVKVGVLEEECLALNRRFICLHTHHRPYVTLKWAQTSDGFIDRLRSSSDPGPLRISTPLTQLYVHQLRASHQAIMVGTRTALMDNPSLNVRRWAGPDPLRVVIDRRASLPPSLHLLSDGRPTLLLTDADTPTPQAGPNVEYLAIHHSGHILPPALRLLYERQVQSLLVEGGAILHQSFIDAHLWDEAVVETAPFGIGQGVPAPRLTDASLTSEECHDGQVVRRYRARGD